ncbi:MAG TPA: ProQ/FinO family protein, partial [Roseateles sp.]|nr:ProQ/FinO family protein [Roseateles sp.]
MSSSPNPGTEAAVEMTPAAALQQLKALFPALFDGAHKPLKLRIQADIQERAPGQFSKQLLSAVLRRYTGGTGYLIALSKASERFDLDGNPAGELSAEHRDAAAAELTRRRGIVEERRALEQQQRRNRAALLRDFQTTTLTRANFCALKGVAEEELDGLL